ncbi:cellobiose phosphorylase [Paenibacillus sambharensis]|uniref:Cellobiose phosphorylase n=1 Tax=Paenibacillus sambharensis TaxID=1803190 RepID=A0A2W1L4C6_9BACL|nr:cellobiose phosphorylase [Paenibacillus sambharensis]PZD93030.1 cellobiose phosphorylase [Paenibacillus sambharensis]
MGAVRYEYDDRGRFVVEQYNRAEPFSSFLPGIAGTAGIPLWLYYVNRGQGVASFGVEDKNSAIMEFFPANKSYQLVPYQGFRTFIRYRTEQGEGYLEPFAMTGTGADCRERMLISPNMLELEGSYPAEGLSVEVGYFTMPGESFAALVRDVTVTNTSGKAMELEALDGMPAVIPYGMNHSVYKELGYTMKSWMDVQHLESGIPLYNLRGSIADTAEMDAISGGHFYLGFTDKADQRPAKPGRPIVDMDLIFAHNTSLSRPDGFLKHGLAALMSAPQVTTNKVPGAFTAAVRTLQPGESLRLVSMAGHVKDIERIHARAEELASFDYIERKKQEAAGVVSRYTQDVETRTAMPQFDEYVKQSYLDNFLRGGYPLILDNGTEEGAVYHVFSRKHGDLERDYNFFKLLPSFYSQGNGNYRDANQNRRCDIFFHPQVHDFNIRMFLSFIQPDGYNPLVVKGCSFRLKDDAELMAYVAEEHRETMRRFFERPYHPGELLNMMMDRQVSLTIAPEQFMQEALRRSEQSFEAEFGEGYWIDHWTYNLDLVESYLVIYPDRLEEVLHGRKAYAYYDSPAAVAPRSRKYVLAGEGRVRQYNAVEENEEKERRLSSRSGGGHWVRTGNGGGEVYLSTLFEKLLMLAAVKFATLDPEGLGVEMEAGKPGWNDSMNGLPGLFASGFGETCELKRLMEALQQWNARGAFIPAEAAELIGTVELELDRYEASQEADRDFGYWDRVSTARELYRSRVAEGFEGTETELTPERIGLFLERCLRKLDDAMQRALAIGKGIYPTFFCYEAEAYTPLGDADGNALSDAKGRQFVRVERFRRVDVPRFLEGPVRAFKVLKEEKDRRQLYAEIRGSGIYDRKLSMYKVNESLAGQPLELGRSTIFTPGWLENESVFMHMSYKYLLELLKAGLYEEFFEDMRHAMPPFLDPAVYGRSILENSSFIASSANPDETLHGRGFVARLSGSTAEFLNMWFIMMAGKQPFRADEGGLTLQLMPSLPGWLFDEAGDVRFRFLSSCEVTYRNPQRKDTFALDGSRTRYTLTLQDGTSADMQGAIHEPYASLVRSGSVPAITVQLPG